MSDILSPPAFIRNLLVHDPSSQKAITSSWNTAVVTLPLMEGDTITTTAGYVVLPRASCGSSTSTWIQDWSRKRSARTTNHERSPRHPNAAQQHAAADTVSRPKI